MRSLCGWFLCNDPSRSVSSLYSDLRSDEWFERLKEFDRSTVVSRKGSQAPTPPTSVKGIGGKGACLSN
jgi:hypothetical protein